MDPATIAAWASLFSAIGIFINAMQNLMIAYHARREAQASKARGGALSSQIAKVDVKVDAVADQTNGHMTTLIAAVAPVDPPLAAATMVKIQCAADSVKERLDKISDADHPEERKGPLK